MPLQHPRIYALVSPRHSDMAAVSGGTYHEGLLSVGGFIE
jgi:hypothetical protein